MATTKRKTKKGRVTRPTRNKRITHLLIVLCIAAGILGSFFAGRQAVNQSARDVVGSSDLSTDVWGDFSYELYNQCTLDKVNAAGVMLNIENFSKPYAEVCVPNGWVLSLEDPGQNIPLKLSAIEGKRLMYNEATPPILTMEPDQTADAATAFSIQLANLDDELGLAPADLKTADARKVYTETHIYKDTEIGLGVPYNIGDSVTVYYIDTPSDTDWLKVESLQQYGQPSRTPFVEAMIRTIKFL
jgi:hypothetical protein